MFATDPKPSKTKVPPHSTPAKKKTAARHDKKAQDGKGGKGHAHGGKDAHGKSHPGATAKMAMYTDGGAPRPPAKPKPHPKPHHGGHHGGHKEQHKPAKKVCHAHVTATGRTPSGGVLQVVPPPSHATLVGFSGDFAKEVKEYEDLRRLRARSGSFQDFCKAVRKRDKRNPGNHGTERTVSRELGRWTGGASTVTVAMGATQHCDGALHEMKVTGPDGLHQLSGGHPHVRVKYHGHDSGPGVHPSVYVVHAKETHGNAEPLHIQVFPSAQTLGFLGISLSGSIFEKVAHGISRLLKAANGGGVSFEVAGSVSLFEGWREEDDWRAYHATEVSAEASASVSLDFPVTVLEQFCHVPHAIAKYGPDIGVDLKLTGSLAVRGTVGLREYYQVCGSGPGGSIGLVGRLGLSISIFAHAGGGLLGAKAYGEINPGITASGDATVGGGKVVLNGSLSIDETKLKVEVKVTAAFIIHATKKTEIHLWDKHDIVHAHPWQLWPR